MKNEIGIGMLLGSLDFDRFSRVGRQRDVPMLIILHTEMDLGLALNAQESVLQVNIRKHQDSLLSRAQARIASQHSAPADH
ncbi:MAG TPA: hypothetical protein VKB88_44165 [Bryobacteraceae bacterium]|nr:hypothetical protein [Bryobacteraceae bacterium]